MSETLITEALERMAMAFPGRVIPRQGQKGPEPYLHRHYLRKADVENHGLFLHRFVASDDAGELHNHPWEWSRSFILSGSYREIRAHGSADRSAKPTRYTLVEREERILSAGDVNFLGWFDFHRVELLTPEVWTIFVHGPRIQTWGFVPERFDELLDLRPIHTRTFSERQAVQP